MSRRISRPRVVYEIVPERFAAGIHNAPEKSSPLVKLTYALDYFESLSVDALVLSPIFPGSDRLRLAATDYFHIDPAIGTEAELAALCASAKERSIDIVMSGVFDHVSKDHEWFQTAVDHKGSDEGRYLPSERTRAFFLFGDEHEGGYRCCEGDLEKPDFDLRNPVLRRRLFTGEQSVFHHWLNTGIRGWRMLRAGAVGYSILRETSRASQTAVGHHFVVGDVRGFGDRYVKDGILDGVVGHYQREALVSYLRGQIPARQMARVMRDVTKRYGRAVSSSWNLLGGLRLPRIDHILRSTQQARLATVLSYTLPGVAHIFYGDEVGGLAGKKVPQNLPPMRDLSAFTKSDKRRFALHERLGKMRRERLAFDDGDFVDLTPEGEDEIFAFARGTKDPKQTVIVVVNRASQTRVRKLFAPFSDLPNGLLLRDIMLDDAAQQDLPIEEQSTDARLVKVRNGSITVEVGGQDVRILVPDENSAHGTRLFREY